MSVKIGLVCEGNTDFILLGAFITSLFLESSIRKLAPETSVAAGRRYGLPQFVSALDAVHAGCAQARICRRQLSKALARLTAFGPPWPGCKSVPA